MSQSVLDRRILGRSGLSVTGICIGGSPLGHLDSESEGVATAAAAFRGPFNFLDTSNNYADGESERRIGSAIGEIGGVPDGFVLATKVDGQQGQGFDADRVRRSLDESLERLGVSTLELLYFHDPHNWITPEQATAPGGPIEALQQLQAEGVVAHLGVGMGPRSQEGRYIRTGVFDVMLTHSRFTLLDRGANDLIDEANALGLGVINAAPFGGGVLAKGPSVGRYAYGEGSQAQLAAATAMYDACERAGVPIAAAALQFSTRDPRIHVTAVGASEPSQIAEFARLATTPVPQSLWDELESLTPGSKDWLPD